MTNEQLLNSLQGTMATIDPYSVKKEAIDEYLVVYSYCYYTFTYFC
jgi:hypothetical protein